MKSSTNILVFFVLIGFSSFVLGLGIHNEHDWGDDFSSYIMQARSLVQGNPSTFLDANRITIEQSSYPVGPLAYPWGFPLLLAPLYALFGVNMLAFKALNIVCYLFFLALLWFAWPQCHSPLWRFVFVSLFAWNPYLHEFMNQVLSDVPFLLFSTFAVILICRVAVERRWLISREWDYLLMGLVIAASCLIRVNGILLVIILLLTFLINAIKSRITSFKFAEFRSILSHAHRAPSFKVRILLMSCGSLFLAFLVWQAFWFNEQYFFAFAALRRVTMPFILERIHYYIDLPADFFTGLPHQNLVYGATIPLALAGMFQRRGSDYPMIIYGVLTVLLPILTIPENQGLRYIFPILPFYMHFVLVGMEWGFVPTIHKPIVPRMLVRLVPAFLILFYFAETTIVNATTNHAKERPPLAGPYLPTSQQVFSFISQSTASDSVIVFFKPRAMKLFTDRQSILIKDANELNRGDYLCLYLRKDAYDQVKSDDIDRLLQEGQLSLVNQNGDFRVYRINKSHNKSTHANREIGMYYRD